MYYVCVCVYRHRQYKPVTGRHAGLVTLTVLNIWRQLVSVWRDVVSFGIWNVTHVIVGVVFGERHNHEKKGHGPGQPRERGRAEDLYVHSASASGFRSRSGLRGARLFSHE
jgi:hypothetical protein